MKTFQKYIPLTDGHYRALSVKLFFILLHLWFDVLAVYSSSRWLLTWPPCAEPDKSKQKPICFTYMMVSLLALFLILLALPDSIPAQTKYDSRYQWRSIESQNFIIHYHQGLEQTALDMVDIAERVHSQLVAIYHWMPFFRTDVVLVDNTDMANGFSSPFPYNHIHLFVSRPEMDSTLENYNNWLELVFTHEYVHTLTIDQANGLPSGVRHIFGRFYFPNMYLPSWQIEGIAVYQESQVVQANVKRKNGRLHSTFANMVMRTEFIKKSQKNISEASHFPRRWPQGSVPYLYGGNFIAYVNKRYQGRFSQDNSYAFIFNDNSDNIIPFLNDKNNNDVYRDLDLDQLWLEWHDYEMKRWMSQANQIRQAGLDRFQKIISLGGNSGSPIFSADGQKLFFFRQTPQERNMLMSYHLTKKSLTPILLVNNPRQLALINESSLLINDLQIYDNHSIYYELYFADINRASQGKSIFSKQFSPKNEHYHQLSHGLRAQALDYHAASSQLAIISSKADRYSLSVFRLPQNQVKSVPKSINAWQSFLSKPKVLIADSPFLLSYCRFSPDGNKLSFVSKDLQGLSTIIIIDLERHQTTSYLADEYSKLHPAWHPDSNKLVFSYDKTGIYNLYEIDLSQSQAQVSQITNVQTGAMQPTYHPQKKQIAFALYDDQGFDIALINLSGASYQQFNTTGKQFPINQFMPPEAERPNQQIASIKLAQKQSQPYSPWRNLIPAYWLPIGYSEEIYQKRYDSALGISLSSVDALYQHEYTLSMVSHTNQQRAEIQFDYSYLKLKPDISIGYQNNNLAYGQGIDFLESIPDGFLVNEYVETYFIQWQLPQFFFRQQQLIFLTAAWQNRLLDFYQKFGPMAQRNRFDNQETALLLGYAFDNSERLSFSISPEHGRQIYLQTSVNNAVNTVDPYGQIYFRYMEFFPSISENHVLAMISQGGINLNSRYRVNPFPIGKFASIEQSGVNAGIRGYPSGLAYGNQIGSLTFEYRFPVYQRDLGHSHWPLLFRDLWLVAFTEAAMINDIQLSEESTATSSLSKSIGIQLHLLFTAGYQFDISGYLGYAYGLDSGGEQQIYFALGNHWESGISANKTSPRKFHGQYGNLSKNK